jgi:hypothetical protein
MTAKLEPEIYLQTQQQILLFAQLVESMPLAEFIEAGEFSDSFAPFVDPTLYIAAAPRLREIIKVARALFQFQQVAAEVRAAIVAMPAAKLPR